ncbi:ATP-binding protein [Sphingomonas sp. GB1N7]|uniref:ATP-binding protein n=1 Tax=Parasphingomonas caseinilytica TaxID=3096158 RepID=UPI003FA69CC3
MMLPNAFGDHKITTALLDRISLHCHIVETGNAAGASRAAVDSGTMRKKSRLRYSITVG